MNDVTKIKVTDKDMLDKLYAGSALTLEGLSEESIPDFLEWLENLTPLTTRQIYLITGELMNTTYSLTGSNAYPNDLTIVCVRLEDMEDYNKVVFPRFQIGGRWFDDVVDNNIRREENK